MSMFIPLKDILKLFFLTDSSSGNFSPIEDFIFFKELAHYKKIKRVRQDSK